MTPHPDFAALEIPTSLRLGSFALEMLTAADLEEDYAAVTGSSLVLQGVFGPVWPEGLTLAYNETDLHWHHREFTAKRSYAWVIRDAVGAYVGCAYLSPDLGARGAGQATYWMVDAPERLQWLADFGALYVGWLREALPEGYDFRVVSNAGLP
ncbi:MAG: hypothetical protein AAF813_10750 [Pseudomonadota bacterium]